MTAKETAHRLLDQLPEAEVPRVIDFMTSRTSRDGVDDWGDLDSQTDSLFAGSMKELAAEERRAGVPPWERKTGA